MSTEEDIGRRVCPLTDQELVGKLLVAIEALCNVTFYAYQRVFVQRVTHSILLNDGAVVTALWARQCGKSTAVACLGFGLCVWLPALAQAFPDDDRLSSFKEGFRVGIFAPVDDQAKETFGRMRDIANSEHTLEVLADPELGLEFTSNRGDQIALTNGSHVRCKTASEDAQIEGKTYDLVLCEEAQKIPKTQVEKSIRPMLASTNGTMVKIGTAWESRGGFHTDIQRNVDIHRRGGVRNHFEIPYDSVIREKQATYDQEKREYDKETELLKAGTIKLRTVSAPQVFHLKYEKFVKSEIAKYGGIDTAEFKMNFRCMWSESRIIAIDPAVFAAAAVVEMDASRGPMKMGFQVAGLDLGKRNDKTVLTLGMVDYANPFVNVVSLPGAPEDKQTLYPKYVQDWFQLDGPFEGTNGQFEAIVEYLRYTNVRVMAVDATALGGDIIFERLEAMIGDAIALIPFVFGTVTKSNGYKYLLQELKGNRLFYPAGSQTTCMYEYQRFVKEHLDLERVVSGNYTLLAAPDDDPDAHDDYPDSLMLMCHAERMAKDVQMPVVTSSTDVSFTARRPNRHMRHVR